MTKHDQFERDYDREMFRSEVFSALWSAFHEKKKTGLTMSKIADMLGRDKGYISRFFSKQENCKINTISDISFAIGVKPVVEFVDPNTGARFTSTGIHRRPQVIRTSHVFNDEPDAPQYSRVVR